VIDPTPAILIYLILAAIWMFQFVSFMLMDNEAFRGAYDKLIWGAAFILVFPIAPFAFMLWKHARSSY